MADTINSTKDIVREISEKQESGQMSSYSPLGALFENVIDTREGKGNYTLAQFFDSYYNFITNSDFVYWSDDGTPPVNQKVAMWVDASITNHEQWGISD